MVYLDRRQKCKKCGAILETGITTEYDEETDIERCKSCKAVIRVVPDAKDVGEDELFDW